MMITQSKLKELLNYDPETGVFTQLKARSGVRVGEVAGCVDKGHGYMRIGIDGKLYRAHRLAWVYMYGTLPPEQIDHINRDRSDNRICNLRLATHAENHQNRSIPTTNTSGHIGVTWHQRDQKWQAQITINYKNIYLGKFHDLSEAIAARKAAELQYHAFQNA